MKDNIDTDHEWLLNQIQEDGLLSERSKMADKVARLLKTYVEQGMLPYTLGVFGGWGTGKTTFLAMVARRLQACPNYKVIYFNSWKYAGFMEIVPSLIYKILRYGVTDTRENRDKAAMRVLLSLGKEYSDRFGEWAEQRIGINPVGLFKDVYKLKEIAAEGKEAVRPELLEAYYDQVDKAQAVLVEVLGQVTAGQPVGNPVIVLIDELDRCDPDEAFTVIKQMLVLFAMRRLPVAFVVCANPDPIGQAIKHRYGLESTAGDYETRRILEKFVDAYEDFSESTNLGALVNHIWSKHADCRPWIVEVDAENGDVGFFLDTIKNAQALRVMDITNPQYVNLRVLRKAFDNVSAKASDEYRHLLWPAWHLEIVAQIDTAFRQEVRILAEPLGQIVRDSYGQMAQVRYHWKEIKQGRRLLCDSTKGATLFSVFRSLFWENATGMLNDPGMRSGSQSQEQAAILKQLLARPARMDFLIILSLLKFENAPGFKHYAAQAEGVLPDLTRELDEGLKAEFSWLLANY